MSTYRRRLERLEAMYAPAEVIPVEYLFKALPPLSAEAAVRYDAWLADDPGVLDDPGRDDHALTPSDLDFAEAVIREIPSDMVISASGCAGLLVSAYFLWDRDRFGEDYAWRHLRHREGFERQLAPRFEVNQ